MTTKFEQLLDVAADALDRLAQLHQVGGALSPAAYVAAAQQEPGADDAQADKIIEAMMGFEASQIGPSFRRLLKATEDASKTSPIRKFGGYIDEAGDAVLARLGATRQSMFLACARTVAARHPEKFGKLDGGGVAGGG
jgi:hypothetical protein